MEDGVKEESAKPKEVKCAGKAGWLKKSSGKFLSSYKDRYIQLARTEIVIYEDEELTTCLEKLDLDNFENCHELKSPFKKKHRLVLIRSPKSGSKVQDVKFQAQTPEDKAAWIKALSEGISKAKNKVFDEVKVDESCSLEHVTRSRPKGNRSRRPPTRIHMKEAANSSSDGILRLDLDGEVTVLNGTHGLNTEGDKETETLKTLNDIAEEDVNEDSTPQKNVVKPPMPPSKDNKPNNNHKEDEDSTPQKKILTPPMPPSKENKPSGSVSEDKVDIEAKSSSPSEPTPSSKSVQPPAPPSKHMKPSQPVTTEKLEEVDGNNTVDAPPDAQKKNEKEDQPFTLTNKIIKPQVVMWDSPSTASKEPLVEQEKKDSQKDSSDTDTTEEVTTLKELHQLATPERVKKSPGPPAPPKKPVKPTVKTDETSPQSNPTVLTISVTPSSEKLSEPSSDKGDVRPTTPKIEAGGDLSSEDLEEKSLDSGQHSGEESEIGDQVTASAAKLKDGSQGLDGETSEDDLDPSDSKADRLEEPSLEKPTTTPESSVLNTHPTSNQCASNPLSLTLPLKHSAKARSASLGDLLFQNTDNTEGTKNEIKPHGTDVEDLQSKVSLEIAKTEELLSVIATGQGSEMVVEGRASPEILLNAAMEKLRKADQFLKEAKGFKDLNKNNRLSL